MGKKLELRNGYMKFWRLGTIEFAKQDRWLHRAPASRGLWAFPYPYFDEGFAFHQYHYLLPKHLRDLTDWNLDPARAEWVKTVGRKVLSLREFWYRGDLFTHFLPNGEVGSSDDWEGIDWHYVNTTQFASAIRSTHGHLDVHRNHNGALLPVRTTVAHLEVFIPPGRGTLRDTPTGTRRK